MGIKKLALIGFFLLTLIFTIPITHWDGVDSFTAEMKWVFQELPEVKSIELIDAFKKLKSRT
jgi:hypothetical protein